MRCQHCGGEFEPLHAVKVWDDQEQERYQYSQVLNEDELRINFPGEYVHLNVCRDCYLTFAGTEPSSPVHDTEPTPPTLPTGPTFLQRTLQSALATSLVRAMFEHCGYEVKQSGYEFTTPEWREAMKAGDPNLAVVRIRTSPDLRVYDRYLNSLYDVEVKSTSQKAQSWLYRQDRLDTMRSLHPESIIVVYTQRIHKFYAQRVSDLDWAAIPVKVWPDHSAYAINLTTLFVEPPSLFERVSVEAYSEFLRLSREVLRGFGPQS